MRKLIIGAKIYLGLAQNSMVCSFIRNGYTEEKGSERKSSFIIGLYLLECCVVFLPAIDAGD